MTHTYDGDWDETTTMMRPIELPTYQQIWDLPDCAEVVLFAEGAYQAMNMHPRLRERMKEYLELNEPERAEHPDQVYAAELCLWIHPDDMSDEKRANIAVLMLQYEAEDRG